MTLSEAQRLHVRMAGRLLVYLHTQGYEATWGQTLRTQAEADANAAAGVGISKSLHLIGLAMDINLWRNGVYLTDSVDYQVLGTYWKSLHPLCRWGGDFKDAQGRPKPDGNHFSIEWEGRK